MVVDMRLSLNKLVLVCVLFLLPVFCGAEEQNRWSMSPDGGIEWLVDGNLPHYDHIEMSGKRISVVLRYGVNAEKGFEIEKSMVWPMLRTVPNNTHASLMRRFSWDPVDFITAGGRSLKDEKVKSISLDGTMTVRSEVKRPWLELGIERRYFPSTEAPVFVESYTFTNTGKYNAYLEIPETGTVVNTAPELGVDGAYTIEMGLLGHGCFSLAPGESLTIGGYITAHKAGETTSVPVVAEEIAAREALVAELMGKLCLETPDKVIDRMFAFSKLRACESIYQTKGGPMHGPGGESYYAAIWANDQAEYVNPFFPYMGYDYGNESAINSYRHFARFMNDGWEPIPSSIVAEGDDIWNGAGDRGDAAMIAYGASRFCLEYGDEAVARELLPLIEWCLEYCGRKLNDAGVVMSDTDELENRFESGDANLCTSALYYDALVSASHLYAQLGKKGGRNFLKRADALKKSIDSYFGSTVEGFDTYRYYAGNEVLRSWICIPLTVGIFDRKDATISALFSPRLWTENGLLTEAGSETFWDRSTLYALRGVYAANDTDRATRYLHDYSRTRLLGEHVPYAIEAWPEGEQRHLSAESGLYARIITEGMFGFRPLSFRSFSLAPRLPSAWNEMALRHIMAYGSDFDVEVSRIDGGKLAVKVISDGKTKTYKINEGAEIIVKL